MTDKTTHDLAVAFAHTKLIQSQQEHPENNGYDEDLRLFLKSYHYALIFSFVLNLISILLISFYCSVAYQNFKESGRALFEYIEGWYNRKRIHSAIGYMHGKRMK